MMMSKVSVPVGCLLGLFLLIMGCSSSQQIATDSISTNAVSVDSQVNAIVAQSCYECHSNGGKAPWYASFSPTYLAANSAREKLNFSDWQTYDAQRRADALKSIEKSVSAGSMPPGDYTALDHSARLTDDQKHALLNWASLPGSAAH
jgi:hypothetical protein